MTTSPPSFDHLPFATENGGDHRALPPLQAQIYRNGRMKYARTRTGQTEVVMPDGEIVLRDALDDEGQDGPFGAR